jgi:uncharacterized BrkB/YihY/UPF0761 family membrane protein
MSLNDVLRELDRREQERPRTAFLAGVVKKFSDDQGGQLAGLTAYYGFVSLFPLLLVLVTVLGFVLEGDPDLQHEILNATLATSSSCTRCPEAGSRCALASWSRCSLAWGS